MERLRQKRPRLVLGPDVYHNLKNQVLNRDGGNVRIAVRQ